MLERRHLEPDESGTPSLQQKASCRNCPIISNLNGESNHPEIPGISTFWLQKKVFSQKTSSSDYPFQKTPNTARPQNSTSRFPSRVHQTTARTTGKPECKGGHTVDNCEDFKRGTVTDRLALLRRMGACFTCFKTGNRTRDCRKPRKCSIYYCDRNYHQLLH